MHHLCYSIRSACFNNTPHYCNAIWFVLSNWIFFLLFFLENLSVHCAAIVVTQEAISLMVQFREKRMHIHTFFQLLQLCKKRSRKHYATIFVKESLNARFEVENGSV